ncbi:MAG: M20/M25/M40 family metallo-hydrolase [Planctomycetes bacterium]|nr:M20/M25/M40 family metallo-hydrolase [Planctomycetota bacterium]
MRLTRLLFATAALLAFTSAVVANDTSLFRAPNMDSITMGDVKGDVYFLASDEMKGRETLRAESDITAQYVRNRFERAGVEPAGEDGGWWQNVKLKYREWQGKPGIRFERDGQTVELKYEEDFVSTGGAETSVKLDAAEIAFVGYAINDPERGYDDISGANLSGKIALMLRYEPSAWRQGGRRNPFSRHSYLQTKEALCRAAGAVAILMVTGPESLGGSDNDRQLPSPEAAEKSPPLSLDLPEGERGDASLPFFHISVSACDELLGGEGETGRVQRAFDSADLAARPDLSALRLNLAAESREVHDTCRNVAGMIRGELDEWIIFGAHHDHLGYGYFGSRDRERMGEIHNGADDNASGVATVLEIAEAMAESGVKPRRSFLFLTFTGEEKGLLGSRWYVRHPLVPHDKVYAMINIDMIGRIENKTIGLQGTQCSKLIDRHCRDVAPLFPQLKVQFSDRPPPAASDHWPFYSEAGIPVFFPFGGVNQWMHTAGDDPETINYDDMLPVIKMLYEIGWRLSEEQQYADCTGPVKEAIGPDGKLRDPLVKPASDPDEEHEEEFSRE